MAIDKEYRPHSVEERWSRDWVDAGIFVAGRDPAKPPFCMVIPPPNVTGSLHIGHVLVYTLHDIVARWRRMEGYDVLWLPGTDHAGIATQMVVERELAAEQTDRHALGREAFVERVWKWKEDYGGRITATLRTLGASVDWTRERFTLDEGLSRAVRTVFVRLYREGLVYRDRYIVQWCPRCHTALSDLETIHEEEVGKLYTIRYPAADGRGKGVLVATTRPETMLGDTAVAVHPEDERYAELVGKRVVLPLVGREIPVIADPFVDPAFGTGVVKVTPAHDPNDFAAGRRHGLEEIPVIEPTGRMASAAGEYAGIDRFQARKKIVSRLQDGHFLLEVRDHRHAVGRCQRCHTVVEPLISTQWFVRIRPLAEDAMRAVEDRRTEFVPANWTKTYFEWMRNIHDWCISRQLWWGHRIPAWYCDACGTMEVAEDAPARCPGCEGTLRQDEDVLDTWFSSALWPFSTLGWPETTPDLARFYPTNVLITGFDIIFFWVARMMMMGLKFMGDVPFRQVYIHGLVRDAHGQKMSKSKGNTVDPLELQRTYGTDAVRLTMAILAAPGNDIPLSPERMDGYRAFVTKLWNACRFVLLRVGDDAVREGVPETGLGLVDRWILSRTHQCIDEVQRSLEQYRFDRAADAIYHFVWHEFCDWYLEMVKADLAESAPPERRRTARAILLETVDVVLRLLHPFVPYVTEELWQRFPKEGRYLAEARWPRSDPARIDQRVERDMEILQELVVRIRNLRAESRIDPSRRVEVLLHAPTPRHAKLVAEYAELIAGLSKASTVRIVDAFADGLVAARGVVRGLEVALPLDGLVDLTSERERLAKDLAKVEGELAACVKKLNNESFLERAPSAVVDKERVLHRDLLERKRKIENGLATLGKGPAV